MVSICTDGDDFTLYVCRLPLPVCAVTVSVVSVRKKRRATCHEAECGLYVVPLVVTKAPSDGMK